MTKEPVKRFLKKHLIDSISEEQCYQCCVLLYFEYLVDGLQNAEKMEYGEVFDEFRMVALVKEMQEAYEAVCIMKKELRHDTELFDVSEQITFPGGYLKAGVFSGDPKGAIEAAKRWIARYGLRLDSPFLFEVGVYILTLFGEEIMLTGN